MRQVIVLTHDLVFLAALLQDAEALDVAPMNCPGHCLVFGQRRRSCCVAQRLERGSNHFAGHVEKGLPWTVMSTGKRINFLRDAWRQLEKVHRLGQPRDYESSATRLYADLRRTWERAIEEILLNQAVLRFRPGIETQRLKKLADITQTDLDAVEAGMTKCSKWQGGHDQAEEVNEPLPPPDKVKADIDALEQWMKGIVARRKN